MTKFLLIIIFLNSVCANALYAQSIDIDSCTKSKSLSCLKLIRKYSNYWKADSLTATGFRNFFGSEILGGCNCFVGMKWSELYDFFGRPNTIVESDKYLLKGDILFRYFLFSSGPLTDYKGIGNRRLDIVVRNGIVIEFDIFEVDG